MKKKWKRILAFAMAVLMVVGILPVNVGIPVAYAATTFTGGETVSSGTWEGWTWSVFGGGTDTTNNIISSDSEDHVTLKSTNDKGKLDSKNDGINYLYYKLDSGEDFILNTTAIIESDSMKKQGGFGIMLRDNVGEHGNTANATPVGHALIGAYKSKDNVYTAGSLREVPEKRSDIKSQKDISYTVGQSYDFTMQKVGDTVYMAIDGELIEDVDIAKIISDEDMYIGLTSIRNVGATYTNTTLDTAVSGAAITLESQTNPKKTKYIKGNTYQDIDLDGFSAKVIIDGKSKTIDASQCRIINPDFTEETEHGVIELDYFGTIIEIPITVITEIVEEIEVQYYPIQTEYMVGDTAIDWSGFDATVIYNSGVTKKLEDLIAQNDEETKISFDFSQAGETEIIVTHTHGNVSKEIKIPVEVSDRKVSEISVTSGPNQKIFYKGVNVEEDAYKDGLQITVTYDDNSKRVLMSGFEVKAVSEELDIAKVGTYTYQVSFGGKTTEYSIEVIERTVKGLEIAAYPEVTTYVKGTEFTAEGLKVNAVYDSGETKELSADEFILDSSAFEKDTVGEYVIKLHATVEGKVLETSFIAAVREKVDFKYEDLKWNSVVFGQSTSSGMQASVTDNEDGTKQIVLESKEGVGKCTDDGQDGITYYYTVLNPAKDNFEMTAKITVDYFITKTKPDNQEGFGIMVRDSIGINQDSSIYYSNAMAVGGYYGGYNVFGRYGILGQDDTNGRVNVTLHGKSTDLNEQVKEDAPKTFLLTLKKDNTGVYATMTENGEVVDGIDDIMYYLPANTFSSIEEEAMYVGFMTARGAKIEINSGDIDLKITSSAADEPQKFAPEKPITPSVSVQSLTETAEENYELVVNVNTKGLLTINQNGKKIVSQREVEVGNYTFPVSLTMGANQFQFYFEPDATQNISSADTVILNETITRKIYEPESVIYVSPKGTTDGDGTKESPLDIQTAISYCQVGQAIYLLEGTYSLDKTTGVWYGNNGTSEKRKMLMACPDNTGNVVIDFADSNGKATKYTFDFSGDYWYVSGIQFLNGGGVRVGGNYNTLIDCDFAGHTNSGLSISRTNSANTIEEWPSYNEIISCNSYNNRDASDNNADGFAAKLTCGEGNVFKYCVAAFNADDGWDLFAKGSTGPIGAVEIYDSICYANGLIYNMETGEIEKTKGDGNGFKIGGSGIAVPHAVYNSYSFGNVANGFTNNSNPMGAYINCTGFNNGGSNLELHVYTGVEPQFTVQGFKSFADNSYLELGDLLEATKSESTASCINHVLSKNNYFYNAQTGVSVNRAGQKLTAENFHSVAGLADFIKGGIASVKRDEKGAIDLGDFLKYRTVSVSKKDDDDDDRTTEDKKKDSAVVSSYESQGILSREESVKVVSAAVSVFGSASEIKEVEKSENGICITSGKDDVIFVKNDTTLAKNEWQLVGTNWYYFDADNKAASGWKVLGGKWYFLDSASKKMASGWLKSPFSGKWYYLEGQNGDMQTGWQQVNGKWYYMDSVNGDMKTGWQQVNGKWYYMDIQNGDCLLNTITPDGYQLDENGAWIQ